MPEVVDDMMPDEIWRLIVKHSEPDELNIKFTFEGDWGNWNWIYNKISEYTRADLAERSVTTSTVDVEVDELKIDNNPYDPEKELMHWKGADQYERGWNECIDTLHEQGYFKTPDLTADKDRVMEQMAEALKLVNDFELTKDYRGHVYCHGNFQTIQNERIKELEAQLKTHKWDHAHFLVSYWSCQAEMYKQAFFDMVNGFTDTATVKLCKAANHKTRWIDKVSEYHKALEMAKEDV